MSRRALNSSSSRRLGSLSRHVIKELAASTAEECTPRKVTAKVPWGNKALMVVPSWDEGLALMAYLSPAGHLHCDCF